MKNSWISMTIKKFRQNPKKIKTIMSRNFSTAFTMYLNDFDRLENVRCECVDYLTKRIKTLRPFVVLMLDYLETFIKNNCKKNR